jgi:hypothetical protein
LIASCEDGRIRIDQNGRTVVLSCDRGDRESCRALFRRMAQSGASAEPAPSASAETASSASPSPSASSSRP